MDSTENWIKNKAEIINKKLKKKTLKTKIKFENIIF